MSSQALAARVNASNAILHTLLMTIIAITPPAFIGWQATIALDSKLLGMMSALLTVIIGLSFLSAIKPARAS